MATATTPRDADTAALQHELQQRIAGDVRFDDFSRVLYSTDASIYQMKPIGVVIPRNADDVQAAIEVAAKHGVPILPRCGGTSLAGQGVNTGLVLDFSKHMNQLLEVNAEERWARVQPGIVLDHLNRQLYSHGYHYAPDPTTSNRACVGGGIGNNTCGSHSVIYGKTVDHVMEVQTVLSDGSRARFGRIDASELEGKLSGDTLESQIYRGVIDIAQANRNEIEARYPKVIRRVSGYNLEDFMDPWPAAPDHEQRKPLNMARMVVGSEGTLCTVTEAKINLVPRPVMRGLAVVHFQDLIRACEATIPILEHQPSAVELVDRMMLDRCRESLGFARNMSFLEGEPDSLLLVEFYGESEEELRSKLEDLKSRMLAPGRRGKGGHAQLAYASVNMTDAGQQASVWAIRRAGLGLLMSVHGDAKPLPYVEDTAVDPERLGEYVRRFDQVVRDHDTKAGYYGHASVGCLHIRPLVSLKDQQGIDRMVSIAEAVSDLVLEFGGSLSGEHGDGIVRGVFTEKMFGPQIYNAFRQVKRVFDPKGIMNPGKIIDTPPMTENLRFGTAYQASSPIATLDFAADTNFAGAVEQCNGMGACRKTEGIMCPSYMVTHEEEHSTRGRANLLRAVLSGALPKETLTSKRLYETMDLCIECKGCKAECPSGVDMAKLKYEFLDKYTQANGLSLRGRIFANVNTLSRLACRFAPMSNWLVGNRLSKRLMHSLLGIEAKRQPPAFARLTFPAWFRKHRPLASGIRGEVVLFNDTYMNYNYPNIGIAATEVFELAGFKVVLANPVCCGRPMLSKGLMAKAAENARQNVEALYEHAQKGTPIVGCEPSCLLSLRDEYPELVPGEKSATVARNSFLIDEFLAKLAESDDLGLDFNKTSKKVLFHGHCHQKALAGTDSATQMLRLPPNYEVEDINAGCCGMAGAFGYEKEHYDISMSIGDMTLFPAVKAKDDSWEVAVSGVSCRQQVESGTGRRARHIIEVLRDALHS